MCDHCWGPPLLTKTPPSPLEFVRDKQALLWNNGTRLPIDGIFVDEGTEPKGSTWARNPIPRMGEPSPGCLKVGSQCLSFKPPCPQDCTVDPTCRSPGHKTDPGTQQGQCSGDWVGIFTNVIASLQHQPYFTRPNIDRRCYRRSSEDSRYPSRQLGSWLALGKIFFSYFTMSFLSDFQNSDLQTSK